MLLLLALGVRLGALVLDSRRMQLLGFALSVLAALTLIAQVRGLAPSLLSLLFLAAIYLPAVAVAPTRRDVLAALRLFVDSMLVLAVVGLTLFTLQYVGVSYRDYLAMILPDKFVQEGYVTSYPLTYGDTVFRTNGVVFLEASFFSLFLGLAVMVALHLKHRLLWLPVLLAAMVVTVSGNGIVFLGVSLLVALLFGRNRRQLLRRMMVPILIAVLVSALTPLGSLLVDRSTEVSDPDSSASLRFVQPYRIILPAYVSSTSTTLVGNGVGSAQPYVLANNGPSAVIIPVLPKLLFEFGMVGTLAMLAFLVHLLVSGGRRLPWLSGMLVAVFFINAGLQQPTLAALAYLFCSTFLRAEDG